MRARAHVGVMEHIIARRRLSEAQKAVGESMAGLRAPNCGRSAYTLFTGSARVPLMTAAPVPIHAATSSLRLCIESVTGPPTCVGICGACVVIIKATWRRFGL